MSSFIKVPFIEDAGLDQKGKPSPLPKPIINITLQYKHSRFLQTHALVDSGADYNLLPGSWCKYLGINLTKGIEIPILGIGNRTPVIGYRHWGVRIKFEHINIDTFGDFAMEQEIAILGNNGFFDRFQEITFNRRKQYIKFMLI
ncbi:hypothetical protein A3G14_01680 [Candidatus Curtissbacteria bacterium RIFCSPLOWO2_12_FULL_38_9]|uniref:Peptidase A2 domain-containing protein n=2 Tax=Candidatus Curtissiibacteriota TaxID=1752717 RepID=A0A1F5G6T7_9BACT|nr:MAG: hypothetical protein A3D04_04845 [Candidatus Curtissbacteria bacterium RIFCSPHIGHO2_02_FULL_40_16b]OGE13366.1 MAG: hypothetical protein A3G14_01680 [Candidatus Curtissbacteria bacterium RIFCSPLOWO2_12_FULL_38_9]